jgi:uncharacterized metal-binding protein YceD (DUF177 family)
MSVSPQPEFSFFVDVTSLSPSGRHYEISADAAARARVAERLGLVGISSLTAAFDLAPRAGGIVQVTGRVQAELTQTCVVTLAPVPAAVSEEVDARFTTFTPVKAPGKAGEKADKEAEEMIAFGDEEPPEEALDGQIDLGELAVTQLALGLDPYPRAPGAAFAGGTWTEKGEKTEVESPFAILAQLKKKDPSKGA